MEDTYHHPAVPNLSIVIPVYNSEGSLESLIARLGQVLPDLADSFEVILVNDSSQDRSWEVISRFCTQISWLQGINLMRNFGQHNTLLCGIRAARYDIIVTMDDDLQHPPEEIAKLLAELDKGFDVVYGTPSSEQHGLLRDVASQVTKLALRGAMGVEIARNVGPFRAFRTNLREAFDDYKNTYVSIDVLLTWGTTRFAAIPVRHDRRLYGESQYTFRKLILHALNMITGFSVLPLQIASVFGFVFALFGLLVLVYVVARFLIQGTVVAGFPFLASIIAIFSGVQLFSLGIIGEYLARMHYRLMGKPSYIVRNKVKKVLS